MSLAEEVLKGDVRAAARLISLIEDDSPEASAEVESLYPHTGKAYIIGVTGAPGVGKSTITDCLIARFREQGKTIGVVAIDPTSELTGGALLGDRVRMQRHSTDSGVFIRSLATRGWTGGLAKATLGAIHVLDALGKEIIFVETVGSGQVETDIVKAADTVLLVMSPGSGDEIQAMKAGIIESADVIDVNKADKEGAERLKADLETMLELKPSRDIDGWLPEVVLTEAINRKGIDELTAALLKHYENLKTTDRLSYRRTRRDSLALMNEIESNLKSLIGGIGATNLQTMVERMRQGKISPYAAAREILKRFIQREET